MVVLKTSLSSPELVTKQICLLKTHNLVQNAYGAHGNTQVSLLARLGDFNIQHFFFKYYKSFS